MQERQDSLIFLDLIDLFYISTIFSTVSDSSPLLQHKKPIWYAPNKFEAYNDEEIEAVLACLRDGWLAPGPRTAEFEALVSKYFGKKFGIFCNSGSSANVLALHMANLKPGDEVITPVGP